jgi:hypothetical protein
LSPPERILGARVVVEVVVEVVVALALLAALAPASAAQEWDTVQRVLQEAQEALPPEGMASLCWRFTEAGTQLYRVAEDHAVAPEALPEICAPSIDEALVLLAAQAATEPRGPAAAMLTGTIPIDAMWVPACPAPSFIPTVIP